MPETLRRAAFLDRDGVINVDRGYVHRIEDFEFVPGTLEACRELSQRGWLLVVATNQSGIGRGLYTEQDFHRLTDWMRARFDQHGAPLAGVYFCPHAPADAPGAATSPCECRKPRPGMLLAAARELSLDLGRSVLFGDKCEDLAAAQAAGVAHRVLLGKDGRLDPRDDCAPGLAGARFTSLSEAVASAGLAPILAELPPQFESKIVAREELPARIAQLARPVVITNGVFDLLHRGHVTYLARARALGASLVVAVNSDASVRLLGKGEDRPINTEQDRAAILAALESVTLVTIFDEAVPLPVLQIVRPEIYVKGGDYAIESTPEAQLARSWNARAVAIPFEHERSTTALLRRVRAAP